MANDSETSYAFAIFSYTKGAILPRDFIEMEKADKATLIAFIDEISRRRQEAER